MELWMATMFGEKSFPNHFCDVFMVVEITILWNPNAQGLETNGMDVY